MSIFCFMKASLLVVNILPLPWWSHAAPFPHFYWFKWCWWHSVTFRKCSSLHRMMPHLRNAAFYSRIPLLIIQKGAAIRSLLLTELMPNRNKSNRRLPAVFIWIVKCDWRDHRKKEVLTFLLLNFQVSFFLILWDSFCGKLHCSL